jgi:hypothetical protein
MLVMKTRELLQSFYWIIKINDVKNKIDKSIEIMIDNSYL